MNIKLIKAKDVDIAFLLQLRKQTMIEHLEKAGVFLSEDGHVSRVKFHFDSSHVICLNEARVGVLKYIETNNSIEILQFQILPKYQGKGIGNYLLSYIIQLSRDANKNVRLKVLKENPAKFLYERNGFKIYDEDQYEFHMEFIK
ncbi:GNAT family N-acetyltransferase [Aquimarina sp. MMG015]|uniref:GNAT family N-acetyltransferase n=1 Tax=unclassified Aquimarina TaxID=2627091 RepID=UPI000E547489|nr:MULTISPECIES: GNAT family N-acetyltransferase [unclassified Aquimarina]AXT57274.1 N-acetyltransferase [Aquimarina sp. AD1]MBQ4801485.1 GNAT family N-acetyltransferase [Aquimarina sp. MMG015]RKN18291.1 GNAT family N-acetyltransferase [Aquimarina sp. AD1]